MFVLQGRSALHHLPRTLPSIPQLRQYAFLLHTICTRILVTEDGPETRWKRCLRAQQAGPCSFPPSYRGPSSQTNCSEPTGVGVRLVPVAGGLTMHPPSYVGVTQARVPVSALFSPPFSAAGVAQIPRYTAMTDSSWKLAASPKPQLQQRGNCGRCQLKDMLLLLPSPNWSIGKRGFEAVSHSSLVSSSSSPRVAHPHGPHVTIPSKGRSFHFPSRRPDSRSRTSPSCATRRQSLHVPTWDRTAQICVPTFFFFCEMLLRPGS